MADYSNLTLTWTGADGTLWNLNSPDVGISLVGPVEGMDNPEWLDYTQEFAGVDGQDYTGGVARPRHVEWPILLSSESSADWQQLETDWRKSFKPRGASGTWTVSAPNGETRTLRCRLTSDGGYAHDHDPAVSAWAVYSYSLIADDPWWYGDPITDLWEAPAPILFFGGGPASDAGTASEIAPPFGISPTHTFDAATMFNPGDESTWPVWTLKGPITSVTISVAGGNLGVGAVPAGSTMVIDSSPSNPTAYLNGTDVTGTINPWDSRPIPPGVTVPVTLSIDYGTGATISVSAPTKYWTAFG